MERLFLLIIPCNVLTAAHHAGRRRECARQIFSQTCTVRLTSDVHDMEKLEPVGRYEPIAGNSVLCSNDCTTTNEIAALRHVDGRPNQIVVEQRLG